MLRGLGEWVLSYAVNVLFWLWILRWGGAEWLEGSFLSECLISWWAPRWDAEGIKLFGWGCLIISSGWFLVGVFVPEARR